MCIGGVAVGADLVPRAIAVSSSWSTSPKGSNRKPEHRTDLGQPRSSTTG